MDTGDILWRRPLPLCCSEGEVKCCEVQFGGQRGCWGPRENRAEAQSALGFSFRGGLNLAGSRGWRAPLPSGSSKSWSELSFPTGAAELSCARTRPAVFVVLFCFSLRKKKKLKSNIPFGLWPGGESGA